MPGAGPGQKSDGVFRKMVTRVAAWLHSATIAATRRPMRASRVGSAVRVVLGTRA
jgi:hypothetical protein